MSAGAGAEVTLAWDVWDDDDGAESRSARGLASSVFVVLVLDGGARNVLYEADEDDDLGGEGCWFGSWKGFAGLSSARPGSWLRSTFSRPGLLVVGVAYPEVIRVWLDAMRGVFFLNTSRSLNERDEDDDSVLSGPSDA